ncbi:MAG: nitroreductase family protein [Chloroflexota bacterium]|nr:MAG: nitroreductase family protein [Chloroflexota bacterium]
MTPVNIISAIHRRISVRHYEPRPVPEEVLQSVVKSGETSVALDDDIRIRFHLIEDGKLVSEQMTFLTGGKWLFGSSPHFIIATSEEKPLFMLNMGFRMEQMILFATEQGLGTCWIGGLFTEKRMGTFLGLEKDERVIALTPIGYPDTSLYGRIIHGLIHLGSPDSRKRKRLEQIAFGTNWGSPLETQDDELLEALECARLAPSWVNAQPWRFLVNGREIVAAADASGRYSSVRDGKHYYRLDVGIAMAHFFLAAKEIGWDGSWHVTGFDPVHVVKQYAIPEGYEVLGIYRR